MSIESRFLALLRDDRLESVRLQRLDSPARGEDRAFQVILNPKTATKRKPCHAILRTPQAALRRALEEWESRFADDTPKKERTEEDLLG